MRAVLIGLGLFLAACTAPQVGPSYRAAGAQISSSTSFDPARFSGRWYEVAGFHQGGCAVGAVTFTVQKTGDMVITEGPCSQAKPRQRLAKISGPGRLAPNDASAPLWVLWIDSGYRTAVIGTPDGSFGYVLNRTRKIPQDRLNAAREILDFNGYDLGVLKPSGY
ncbi:MAG: apolipoprotein D and lipocalin family protein [Halocynthiibacter sp.]|jgi:apolipoprotein D and lipocalin family protein